MLVIVPRSRVIEVMIVPFKPRIRLMRMSVNRVVVVSVAFFSVVMGVPILSVVLVMAVAKNHNP